MKTPAKKANARHIASLLIEEGLRHIDDKDKAREAMSILRRERGKNAAEEARRASKPADPNQFNLFGA